MSPMLDRLKRELGERYALIRELGQGGVAIVFLAEDLKHSRQVAVKVLKPELAEALGPERFLREIEVAASLNHPRIVPLLDSSAASGLLYYVMPYVEGESLRDRLNREKQLPVAEACALARQVAAGLAYAHSRGLVHRDIKPENILLTGGEAVVADFGIAKALSVAGGSKLTQTGFAVGTPAYMSPEQASGAEDPDARSDVYSLGCVLYEMLAGEPPFRGATMQVITARKLVETAPDVRVFRDTVPSPVGAVVSKALARIPADRFATATQFAEALERGTTESAAPVTQAGPVASRRQVLKAAGAAGLFALGVSAGVLLPLRRGAQPSPVYRRLTFRRGMIRSARFGPDYQTVLYGALWDGDVCRVHTVRADSPESQPLNLPAALPLAISPQGEIALSLGDHFRGVMTYGTLARVSLAGGAPRELLEDVKFADWSPDGSELAVVRRVDGRDLLEFPLGNVLVDARASGSQAGLNFPRVSPDGDRVAFLDMPSRLRGRVVVVDRKGTRTELSDVYAQVFGLAWHGDEVWFTAADERPLFRAIHAVKPGRSPRLVARVPGNVSLHDIAPDGRVLIAHTDDRGGITVHPRNGARERDLSWHDASDVADISPDGDYILFTEYGHGGGSANSVYRRRTDGSPAVRLGDGRAEGMSPDGRWAIAMSGSDPYDHLDLLPTGPGQANRIQHSGFRYSSARWAPDGQSLIVQAREGDQPARLYSHPLDGSAPRAITPEGTGAPWAISPDGATVAATGANGLLRLFPTAGGDARDVPGLGEKLELVGWIRDGLLLSNASSGNDLGSISRVDPATRRQAPWREITPPDPAGIMNVRALQVAADGRSYAYSWHRALSDLYLVEGLG